ncbi:TetR/AcrR family transcriptional regulator [Streptomyces sp. AJS327]|uniref:TetR/AcrR family transcriptional regulator n=1 Tax=Streptomyces sp. AJS327 TaxID=2545265 RepID=UPI0015DF45AD|nr:TetR/AcrR family transcriptional regulator [Streptomyces sp. AJS327]MBA0049593.1 TetR/AcrR family transcriptional regulator [Streptomyces sp. AJS327]
MSSEVPERRRRADAERSRTAVLDAAIRLFAEQPDAGMAAVARTANVTRQTVYAHYRSREELLIAVMDRLTEEAVTAMDAAALDSGPAPDALLRLLDTSWRLSERHPVIHQAATLPAAREIDRSRHEPVTDRLVRLIERGQHAGEFDASQTPSWLAATVVALGHAAGEEAASGRMTHDAAAAALRVSVLRVLGATAHPGQPPTT